MDRDRLSRLARRLSALAQQDATRKRQEAEVDALRRTAACELYETCSCLVRELNALVEDVRLELSPPTFSAANFRDSGVNLFQIHVNGRVVQISFETTPTLTSNEEIPKTYTLIGFVRCFNQEMIERDEVHEHRLFYVCDRKERGWLWYDPLNHRSGPCDDEYLGSLLEDLA